MSLLAAPDNLLERYEAELARRAPRCLTLRKHASALLAGGVSGDGKMWSPLYVSEANGSTFTDVDGNTYIDLCMGFGPNLLGHSPKAVVGAVTETLSRGTALAIATQLEVELARAIQVQMPSIELMRFVTSGSEATMMALRAARAFTQKQKIAKFEGHYHGQHDFVLISGIGGTVAGEAARPQAVIDCAGIPDVVADNVVVLPWGDIEACEQLLHEHSWELAAVICEPVPYQLLGGEPPEPEFLRALREVTRENGVLLIFDEVVTGFRLAKGGASEYFGVTPDLHTLGKVAGGGFPIGVYGGRRDILESVLGPTKIGDARMFQSGTFSGAPAAMAAGLAMINGLADGEARSAADARAEELRTGWRAIAERRGIPLQVTGMASWFGLHFTDRPVRTRRDALHSDERLERAFALGLLVRDVYMPQGHPGFTSAAHTRADVQHVLRASDEVLAEITELS
jgi:glutamate-1-semialdehyde 2,1-aminomutase